MKPPMQACRHVIWLTQVFTWYNSVVSVSRQASLRSSCAMMASSVTPPRRRRRRRSRGGCSGIGWRSPCLGLWPLLSKLGLTPSNKHCANGTHDGEVRRLRIRSRKMAYDPRDSKRKYKLITDHRIPINIHVRQNKVRREVHSKVLNEGKQKASMRLGNGIIVK